MSSNKIITIGLLVTTVIIESIADFFLKKWSINNNLKLVISGMLLILIASLFYTIAMKFELLSKIISVYSILSILVGIFVGAIIFGEKLSFYNSLGVFFAILAIILIETN